MYDNISGSTPNISCLNCLGKKKKKKKRERVAIASYLFSNHEWFLKSSRKRPADQCTIPVITLAIDDLMLIDNTVSYILTVNFALA